MVLAHFNMLEEARREFIYSVIFRSYPRCRLFRANSELIVKSLLSRGSVSDTVMIDDLCSILL